MKVKKIKLFLITPQHKLEREVIAYFLVEGKDNLEEIIRKYYGSNYDVVRFEILDDIFVYSSPKTLINLAIDILNSVKSSIGETI